VESPAPDRRRRRWRGAAIDSGTILAGLGAGGTGDIAVNRPEACCAVVCAPMLPAAPAVTLGEGGGVEGTAGARRARWGATCAVGVVAR